VRTTEPPIRAIVSKVGLDGHDRGAKIVAKGFRDAGMEVVYTGIRRNPEELAAAVLDEDAEVLGLSILSGAVVPLTRRVMEALHALELDDVVVIVGGIVSTKVTEELKALGVEGAFGPGSSLVEIVEFTQSKVRQRRAESLGRQ
jgi:methylmalonyl-CoA mutase C-terminal domain/subunit